MLSTCHQSRPQWIALDVAANSKEMAVGADSKRLKASLIHVTVTATTVGQVPPLCMYGREPEHEPRQVPVRVRPKNEMKVIWHGAVGQTLDGDSTLSCGEEIEVGPVVTVSIE